MIQFAEFASPEREQLLRLLPQIGVTRVTSALPSTGGVSTSSTRAAALRSDPPWGEVPLALLQRFYRDHGLELAVIEETPPLDRVRLGLDGREQEAAWFCDLLRAMGRLGIGVLCWNFMAGMGWTRTSVAVPARGGALVSGFDHDYVRDAAPLETVGEVPAERMWEHLGWFLERVVPVAEAAGVRMALHPDDPPLSPMRGVARIQTTLDEMERAVELVPSPAQRGDAVPGQRRADDRRRARRHPPLRGPRRDHFAHVRDVRGTPERFVETFHDEGPTDMLACMRAYREVGADVPMRVDHVATLAGDANDAPGYTTLGVLFAVGYLTGVREAAYAGEGSPA